MAALLIWSGIYAFNQASDGFSLREIRSSLPNYPEFEPPLLSEKQKNELHQILSQPFHYIGKGCQFYAFMSQDERYVLKFFKHKHLCSRDWLKGIAVTPSMQSHIDKKIEERNNRIRNLFSSCQLAFEELSEETGVIFLHLNRRPILNQEVHLFDKMRLPHLIAIDDYEFVLQKKAVGVPQTLSRLLKSHDEAKLRDKIGQLALLVASRCEKGIRDRDRSFVQNVAFCEGEDRAVFVDIGQFYKDETIKTSEETKKEILRRLQGLRFWASERNPDLIPYIDEALISFSLEA